ncbi:hypothetical protein PAXRUDRAFT_34934 [Paxillus rubicundulus Ve08.2h10]|uniref:Uncharacterized protein n=1 Tax=Paxillus rubicundulus Ve08.2h10 TaxID=930991 RepID=A0A0D0D4K9_9AGAM|nr:hypothetical protein PAXRUDRAFT_34934 [Paxillus rubicundulus Ve08.2h10]
MDPSQPWYNPATSFAYSLGEPKGSRGGLARAVYCNLLQDSEGNQVPCWESHATCKVDFIPTILSILLSKWQAKAARPVHMLIRLKMVVEAYWTHLLPNHALTTDPTTGCSGRRNGMSNGRHLAVATWPNLSSCEFYDEKGIRDHLVHYGPESGEYDIDYLQALFNEDMDEINAIELEAQQCEFDPAAPCPTIMNHTSV